MPRTAVSKKKNPPEKEKDELAADRFHLEIYKLRLEEDKSWFEFHKHMTTLNTGVIIIVATLIEKVFTGIDPAGFRTIATAFFAFLVSITMSTIGLGYHIPSLRLVRSANAGQQKPGRSRVPHFLKFAKVFLFIASLMGFLMGIFFFIIFALGNTG